MAMNPEEFSTIGGTEPDSKQPRQPPPNVKLIPTTQPDPDDEATNEDQDILFSGGMGDRADSGAIAQALNARVQGTSMPVPVRLLRLLPALRAASQDPNAPASARDFYRTVVIGIESRVKRG